MQVNHRLRKIKEREREKLLSDEKVTYGRYGFEVLEMDNRRILKVKFTVNAPTPLIPNP